MPFDFAERVPARGLASVQAAEALKNDLMSAYHGVRRIGGVRRIPDHGHLVDERPHRHRRDCRGV